MSIINKLKNKLKKLFGKFSLKKFISRKIKKEINKEIDRLDEFKDGIATYIRANFDPDTVADRVINAIKRRLKGIVEDII